MRVKVVQINPTIGDLEGNSSKILLALQRAKEDGAELVLFSELVLTGYPPQDFLLLPYFLEAVEKKVADIAKHTKNIAALVGTPRRDRKKNLLYNSAAILIDGKIVGYEDKILLPTYDVFNERRYFHPGSPQKKCRTIGKERVAITICEDIWQHSAEMLPVQYACDPVKLLAERKPDLLVNLSASPFSSAKLMRRIEICSKAAKTSRCPLLFCNQVGANDSLIFDGHSLVMDPQGHLCAKAQGFAEDTLLIDTSSLPSPLSFQAPEEEEQIFQALVLGVRDYFRKSGFDRALLGLSGGIDSALVACIAAEALGPEAVTGVSMPSQYTPESSREDARIVAQNLGIVFEEVSIEELFQTFLTHLQPLFGNVPPDLTEENLQSRIRGVLLMALSNKKGALVLNSGNKSEMGMGYATLYGDMVGSLGVISDLTKIGVYKLARWINRKGILIPERIIEKAPSAELRPGQKDTDTLPEYDILDEVLRHYVVEHLSPAQIAKKTGISLPIVEDLIRRIHRNEFKRRQSPPGLRISEKAFSIGRQFPIVQKWI